jgi:putative GTP pyrophosphokinase
MSKDKSNQDSIDINQMELEYKEIVPLLEDFCQEMANQIAKLLYDANVALGFPIQYRVKPWSSLSEKLARLSRFKDFRELQDLVGLRIILLFKRDVAIACQVIENYFDVAREYDSQEQLREDQFGYLSKHLIITLKKEWLSVPTLSKMGGLRAEVQVRTVAQHIWSEVSHKLQYKQQNGIPPSVRRSIYRVSALLETVDLEFERVLEQRESYRAQISIPPGEGELNVDLLEKILDSSLPAKSKAPFENYDLLLSISGKLGVTTTNMLIRLLDEHLKSVLELDNRKAQEVLEKSVQILDKDQHYSKYQLDRAHKGVVLSHTGLLGEVLINEFGETAGKLLPRKDYDSHSGG